MSISSAFITLLTRVDGRPAGKRITTGESGEVHKRAAPQSGRYTARTLEYTGTPEAILGQHADLLASLTPSQCVMLDVCQAAGNSEYRIVPAAVLGKDRPVGLHMVDGVPTIARLKENFVPGGLLLLDYDPDAAMPAHWLDWSEAERWEQLCRAWPGLAGAARLVVPSSSGRVLLSDGRPALPGARGVHTYIHAPTADLEALRTTLSVRLHVSGLAYSKQSAGGAVLSRALVDVSVMSPGRIIFSGPPSVGPGLTLAPPEHVLHPGVAAAALAPLTETDKAGYQAATGRSIVTTRQPGRASLTLRDHSQLRMSTRVETEHGVMTVSEFLKSSHKKVRCQATFRESSSWNGILTRTSDGMPCLHDAGAGITYHLTADPLDIPGKWTAALEMLAQQHAANATGYAAGIVRRHAWRVPIKMTLQAMLAQLAAANEAVDRDALTAVAEWIMRMARKRALAPIALHPDRLPPGVAFERHARAADVLAAIQARRATGVRFCAVIKAPHNHGKTQAILRPVAMETGRVIGIAPRISLVADLCAPGRLNLDSYHGAAAAHTDTLGLCINSLSNPKYSTAVDGARTVLIDEAARVLREIHNPHGTMGKTGRGVWDKLCEVIREAELSVLVDADISTQDVSILAGALPDVPLYVYEIPESTREKTARFVDDATIRAGVLTAVAQDIPTLVVADSAKWLTGMAAIIRKTHPEKRVLVVHSKEGTATVGTPEAQALLSDINGIAPQYDVLLLSPTVESGVSLNIPHFRKHFALYCGAVEPSAMGQMLMRDRPATTWTIGIMGNGFRNDPDNYGNMLAALDSSARLLSELDDIGFCGIAARTPYDDATCRISVTANGARNSYAASLWHQLQHRGWRVEHGGTVEAPVTQGDIRDHADAELMTAVLAAPDLPAEAVQELRESPAPTPGESATVCRADVRATTGVTDHALPVEPILVEAWQDGRLMSQVKNFEALRAPIGPTVRDRTDVLNDVTTSARSFDAVRAVAAQALWTALGLDQDGTGSITEAGARAAYDALRDSPTRHYLEHSGIAYFSRTPKSAVKWTGYALAKFGLYLDSARHGHGGAEGRSYQIGRAVKRSKKGVFKAPGWDLMNSFADARATAVVPDDAVSLINTTSVTHGNQGKSAAGMVPDDAVSLINTTSVTHRKSGYASSAMVPDDVVTAGAGNLVGLLPVEMTGYPGQPGHNSTILGPL